MRDVLDHNIYIYLSSFWYYYNVRLHEWILSMLLYVWWVYSSNTRTTNETFQVGFQSNRYWTAFEWKTNAILYNVFLFCSRFFIQQNGTAMGTNTGCMYVTMHLLLFILQRNSNSQTALYKILLTRIGTLSLYFYFLFDSSKFKECTLPIWLFTVIFKYCGYVFLHKNTVTTDVLSFAWFYLVWRAENPTYSPMCYIY